MRLGQGVDRVCNGIAALQGLQLFFVHAAIGRIKHVYDGGGGTLVQHAVSQIVFGVKDQSQKFTGAGFMGEVGGSAAFVYGVTSGAYRTDAIHSRKGRCIG